MLAGVEFVTDKEKRTPFDPKEGVAAAVVKSVFDKGVLIMPGAPGIIDGVNGDHVAISPPFTIDESGVRGRCGSIRYGRTSGASKRTPR